MNFIVGMVSFVTRSTAASTKGTHI